MAFGNLLKNIAKGIGELQKQNRANPNEQTADGSIFDRVKDAIVDIKEKAAERNQRNTTTTNSANNNAPERETMEPLDMLKKRIEEVKSENAADPNVPTAEESVFERMRRMIEEEAAAKSAEASGTAPVDNSGSWSAPETTSTPPPAAEPAAPAGDRYAVGNFCHTDSMGGSLALRQEPDFGAATHSSRIPEDSRIKLLEYSDHTVNIDGYDSRWAKIDFNGTEGWILETYLNFK